MLDPSIDKDTLYRTCRQLDEDNSGSISLDEFISYFGQTSNEAEEAEAAMQDSMLQEDIWPQWII